MYSIVKYPANPESAMVVVKSFGKWSREKRTLPMVWVVVVFPARIDILVECTELMAFTRRVRGDNDIVAKWSRTITVATEGLPMAMCARGEQRTEVWQCVMFCSPNHVTQASLRHCVTPVQVLCK